MKCAWRTLAAFVLCLYASQNYPTVAQDYNDQAVALPPAAENCNGIFLTYEFISRIKGYPRLKNATAQAWAFKSTATILNAGTTELAAWKMFIGFQHKEILVSASGGVLMDGGDFPADVSNGTYLSGSPMADLKTSIDTAGDFNQIQAKVELTGTQFGVRPPGIPMPKTIRLENDGFKCPAPTRKKTSMHVCCVKDKKFKAKTKKRTKFLPRQDGDLLMFYDITQTYPSSYLAQVTIENNNPLGRLDHWNLTWEWMRGEFIYSMKGAYTRLIDATDCIYGAAGKYYGELDFSKVMNCQKKPIISDLPKERYNDTQVGKIPYCCRNGTILPSLMDPTQSKSVFQVQVFKLPPDMNRTAIFPPEKWKINGDLNPDYKCGPPMRVAPTEIPDPSGLQTSSVVFATWQVVCNITKPTKKDTKCCVSFSAYYNDSVIPCNTCACGCEETKKCNPDAPAMLLPSEALLVPFSNRSKKAIAWAKIQRFRVPKPLPCSDNCGVSMNWHISSDYKNGWTARITLFNWEAVNFENWFTAIQLKTAGRGYEQAYSFNGTFLKDFNNTIFIQGLKGLNYLMGETNGSSKGDPKVPGKQQSVISFTKKLSPGVNIAKGDGFPSRVFFNGEECSLPKRIPIPSGSTKHVISFVQFFVLTFVTYFVIQNCS